MGMKKDHCREFYVGQHDHPYPPLHFGVLNVSPSATPLWLAGSQSEFGRGLWPGLGEKAREVHLDSLYAVDGLKARELTIDQLQSEDRSLFLFVFSFFSFFPFSMCDIFIIISCRKCGDWGGDPPPEHQPNPRPRPHPRQYMPLARPTTMSSTRLEWRMRSASWRLCCAV